MRGSTAGLPSTLKGDSATHYAFLSVLDCVFCSVVLAPLVVCFWRSVWELMGSYVYPDDELVSAGVSTVIGIGGHLFFALSQHTFERNLHPDRNRISYYVISRLYTLCFAFVCVNGWRGPWIILDVYTGKELTLTGTPFAVGIIALAAMRTLRNVSAPPFAVTTDYVTGYFQVLTMFRITVCT